MNPKLTPHQEQLIQSLKEMIAEDPTALDVYFEPNTGKTQTKSQPDMYAALTAADAAPHNNPIITQVGNQTVVSTKAGSYITNFGGPK